MDFSKFVAALPRLKTRIQLTGFVVCVAAAAITALVSPNNVKAMLAAGSIGITLIVFGQLFHFLGEFRAKDRVKLVITLFVLYCVFTLILLALAVFFVVEQKPNIDVGLFVDPIPIELLPTPTLPPVTTNGDIILPVRGQLRLISGSLPQIFHVQPQEFQQTIDKLEAMREIEGHLVRYHSMRSGDTLIVRPTMPYIEAVKNGDVVKDTQTSFFAWPLPIISVQLTNPNEFDVQLSAVELRVLSAKPDLEPILMFWSPGIRSPGNVRLEISNLGWGKVLAATITTQLERAHSSTAVSNSSEISQVRNIPDFDENTHVDTGVVLGDRDLREIKDLRLVGHIDYRTEYGKHQRARFSVGLNNQVMGLFATPTYLYNVELNTDKSSYVISRTIAQSIPALKSDHFLVSLCSIRSGYYRLFLRFRTTSQTQIDSPIIDVHIIRGRDAEDLEPRPAKTWLGKAIASR